MGHRARQRSHVNHSHVMMTDHTKSQNRPDDATETRPCKEASPLPAIGRTARGLTFPVVAILGFVLVLVGTPHGIGVTHDSVYYIDGARNIVCGNGYMTDGLHGTPEPITHWPPLLSLVLALLGLSGIDPWVASRWLNASLFGVNVCLTGYLVRRYGTGSWSAAVLAMVLTLVSFDFLQVHCMAWSEPLFVSMTLASYVCLLRHLERPRLPFLVASAFFISLATITRYFGLPFIAAGVLALAFTKQIGDVRRRLCDGVCFGVIAMIPMLMFSVRNKMVAGGAADWSPSYMGVPPSILVGPLKAVASWFWSVPYRLPAVAASLGQVLLFCGLLYVVLLLLRRARRDKGARVFLRFVVLQGACYFMFYAFSGVFLSNSLTSDVGRYMMPLYPIAVALCVLSVAEHMNVANRRILLVLPALCFCLMMIVVQTRKSASFVLANQSSGRGYVSGRWLESETMACVRNLPHDAFIVSNAPDAIVFHTRRPAARVPAAYDVHRSKPAERYELEMQALRRRLNNTNCFIVYFTEMKTRRTYLATPEDLRRELGVTILRECKDGFVCGLDQ